MSSLRFTQPIRIVGLPDETTQEWTGLEVGLSSGAMSIIGHLGEAPARAFDEESNTWSENTFCDLEKVCDELEDKYYIISTNRLIHACKNSTPPRTHLLRWLEKEHSFQYFVVDKTVVEYLP